MCLQITVVIIIGTNNIKFLCLGLPKFKLFPTRICRLHLSNLCWYFRNINRKTNVAVGLHFGVIVLELYIIILRLVIKLRDVKGKQFVTAFTKSFPQFYFDRKVTSKYTSIIALYLIYKSEFVFCSFLFVCLYLIQIHISAPICIKLCTHLPLHLEETVGYVWARNSWPLRPFGPFSLGTTADSWTQDGCRRDRFPRYPYIRDSNGSFPYVVADDRVIRHSVVSLILAGVRVTSRILRSNGRRGHPPQRYIAHSSSCFCDLQEITSLQTTVARSYSTSFALSVMRTIRWDLNGIYVSIIRNLIRREGSD
jgi:hypothetical protein